MPSTHVSLHYHVIFSTKNRERNITLDWRSRLHAYMGGVARNIDAVAETVGGVEDHVHILLGLSATHCIADAIRDIKAVSSRWVHDEMGNSRFAWQEGYGAFTVSPSQRKQVIGYIAKQEEHHRRRTFKEEYVEFLERSGVKYEERYLW